MTEITTQQKIIHDFTKAAGTLVAVSGVGLVLPDMGVTDPNDLSQYIAPIIIGLPMTGLAMLALGKWLLDGHGGIMNLQDTFKEAKNGSARLKLAAAHLTGATGMASLIYGLYKLSQAVKGTAEQNEVVLSPLQTTLTCAIAATSLAVTYALIKSTETKAAPAAPRPSTPHN